MPKRRKGFNDLRKPGDVLPHEETVLEIAQRRHGDHTYRDKQEIEVCRALIARMRLVGYTYEEIAEKTGLTAKTVGRDMRLIIESWKAAKLQDIDAYLMQELARIDRVAVLAAEAWTRSIGSMKKVTTEKKEGDQGGHDLTSTVEEVWIGDPRFLHIMLECIEKRTRLLGLNAPTKQEFSGPGGTPLPKNTMTAVWLTRPDLVAGVLAAEQAAVDADFKVLPEQPALPVGTPCPDASATTAG